MPNVSPRIHDERIALQLPRRQKLEAIAAAKAEGIATNEFIRRAIDDRIAKQGIFETLPEFDQWAKQLDMSKSDAARLALEAFMEEYPNGYG